MNKTSVIQILIIASILAVFMSVYLPADLPDVMRETGLWGNTSLILGDYTTNMSKSILSVGNRHYETNLAVVKDNPLLTPLLLNIAFVFPHFHTLSAMIIILLVIPNLSLILTNGKKFGIVTHKIGQLDKWPFLFMFIFLVMLVRAIYLLMGLSLFSLDVARIIYMVSVGSLLLLIVKRDEFKEKIELLSVIFIILAIMIDKVATIPFPGISVLTFVWMILPLIFGLPIILLVATLVFASRRRNHSNMEGLTADRYEASILLLVVSIASLLLISHPSSILMMGILSAGMLTNVLMNFVFSRTPRDKR